ncbi:TetR/AcrR family transcriptional regulator [Nocardioides sp. GXQ0305]|uniref:TetR/AcrR family transcriptional regulator n=1 Tax=Nocardioides sp. GXQ0305 TaxID=3423912 RepID=UPI003D7E287C
MSTKRRYDASGRRAAAEQRRTRVAEVASDLFARHGWSGTTISAVAAEAGVSAELVSSSFGGKPGLFMAAFRHRTMGGRTLTEAFGELSLEEERDLDARLDRFVAFACDTLERVAPLFSVLSLAADQDADLQLLVEGAAGRHDETIRGAVGLLATGTVPEEAVDELVVITRSEVFLAFRRTRGWSVDQYAAWLRGRTRALLVPDQGAP